MSGVSALALIFVASAADPSYEADVIATEAFVYSGPGAGHYPVLHLPTGAKVTVQGGWSGEWVPIVPPKGSFSWIAANAVEEKSDGNAIVKADDVRVYVGSNLSDAHHVFQITLKKGDRVEVIDQAYLRDEGMVGVWFKILPPPGEKRYLKAEMIRLPAGSETASSAAAITPPKPAAGGTAKPSAPDAMIPLADRAAGASLPAWPASKSSPNSGWFTPNSPPGSVGTRRIPPLTPIETVAGSSPVGQEVSQPAQPYKPAVWRDDASLPFDRRLANVNEELERMRTREPSTWDLDSHRSVLQQLLTDAKSDAERQGALAGLAKVKTLEDLEGTYDKARRRRDLVLQRDDELATIQRRLEQKVRGMRPMFTAQGRLDRAALAIDGKPTYALKDEQGLNTHYVLLAPGLNVSRYVGGRVGLVGTTTTREGVPIPVVTVAQLTPLDDHMAKTEGAP